MRRAQGDDTQKHRTHFLLFYSHSSTNGVNLRQIIDRIGMLRTLRYRISAAVRNVDIYQSIVVHGGESWRVARVNES